MTSSPYFQLVDAFHQPRDLVLLRDRHEGFDDPTLQVLAQLRSEGEIATDGR